MSAPSGIALLWQNEALSEQARSELASQQAQQSFYDGLKAWAIQDYKTAWDLLERANRQAPESLHVMFALVLARRATGYFQQAKELLEVLLNRCDFKEGWILHVALCLEVKDVSAALQALSHILYGFSCATDSAELAEKIYHLQGAFGWCGLESSGQIKWGAASSVRPVLVCCDGVDYPVQKTKSGWFCPDEWQQAEVVFIKFSQEGYFCGNSFSPQRILKCEGFVAEKNGDIQGWAWHPYDAQREPVLRLVHSQSGKILKSVRATILDEEGGAERPGVQYRHFSFSGSDLPSGLVRVIGEDGRDLAGSPLNIRQQTQSASAIAAYLSGVTEQSGRTKGGFKPDGACFFPVPVLRETGVCAQDSGKRAPLALIIPVFRDVACTRLCLEAVRETVQRKKIRVLIINDASPEKELTEFVRDFSESNNFLYIENEHNKGFPGAVNTGLREVPGHDVILLNSDTCVVDGWLEELRRIAYSANNIGTVTPFSNDASILSYPSSDKKNSVPDVMQTKVFMAAAQVANKGMSCDIPTGHGFCLYIRHDCLQQTGFLREDVFAQGYGEENDFCMRAHALGWKHKAAVGVFVAHTGSASFGNARASLMARNSEILEQLHPGYHAFILDWISQDSLSEVRRRFDRVRFRARGVALRTKKKAALLVTHRYGGGVERVIQSRAAFYSERSVRALILRPQKGGCVVEDSACPEDFPSLFFKLPEELSDLQKFLADEGVKTLELHHLLGYHPSIYDLPEVMGCSYDVFIHDYMWFCQRISLLDLYGSYCGEPGREGCERCIKVSGHNIEEDISVAQYLQRSSVVLSGARTVYAPSCDAAERMQRHFPEMVCKIKPLEEKVSIAGSVFAREHSVTKAVPVPGDGFLKTSRESGSRRLRLCVVGAIGREKGYDVLHQAAIDAVLRDLPLEFVIAGYTPDDLPLLKTGRVFITGRYREEEAVSLLASLQADAVFLPSVWPETWCFTLELAWRAGLSVIAFDHGAPAERIRETGQGILIDPHLRGGVLNEMLINSLNIGNK